MPETMEETITTDVVIIGAGASGLQCAKSLLQKPDGAKPTFCILEARNRIGGRIHTVSEHKRCVDVRTESTASSSHHNNHTNDKDITFPRDLGAAWVHGTGKQLEETASLHPYDHCYERNPMMELLGQITPQGKSPLDTHLYRIFEGNTWTRPHTVLNKSGIIALFCQGNRVSNESNDVQQAIQLYCGQQQKISDYVNQLFESGNGMETVTTSLASARSKVADKQGLETNEVVDLLVPFLGYVAENWNGMSESDTQVGCIKVVPFEEMDSDSPEFFDGDYPGPHCKVIHGMENVLVPLRQGTEDHVRREQCVTSISRQADGRVKVTTSSGLTVHAKCCVSTIPVGCLQHQNPTSFFEPPLGNDFQEAIQAIATGTYKKVFLTFDSIFWPMSDTVLGLMRKGDTTNPSSRFLLVYNLWAKDSIPCLEAILTGELGKWSIGKSESEIRNAVLKFLEDSMGLSNLADHCVGCDITRWEEDPWTHGAYSSFGLGTLDRHVELLQTPFWDGQLVFAGEFTESEHMGGVHAALISGDRAARQVLEALDETHAN
eukprot:Nitzschia sp. Nitz4//scaffold11_size288233//89929//91569//NITZ4_000756-RA/size288233-processed-gene-0.214-mRNA-1//-1//CDS//3329534020//3483//frame0